MAESEHPAPQVVKYPMHDLYKRFAKMKHGDMGRQPPAVTGIYIQGEPGACRSCLHFLSICKRCFETSY